MRKKKNKSRLKQIKDYYPITNPHSIEDGSNANIPSEDDIEEAKRWVDETQK